MPKHYQQGCIDVIALDERLTGDNVHEVHAALTGILQAGLPQAVIDLRGVRFIDSAGLECLCDFHTACRKHGGEMRLAAPGRVVRDVLRITGLDAQLGVSDDVIAAAGEFAQ
ncbi:STAS domain protein [Pirellulimonas nuda]|uniref:Anti-sigma factor antagonist n=1 Tax=Pirellulimonas nuda TaxID=2528009 RepID=A0A518DFX2_9BACT|nr:STAS domain-containing protein [Pirellulimonas nuda]QDU90383.1 STAS domain protein [Pirellulimonas nuda]